MRHNERPYTFAKLDTSGFKKYKRIPKNAHEQKRLLLWIAGLVDHVRMHGSEKDLDTLENIGVRLNAKEFYDTEELTQAQYSAYTKLLTNLERRGFIERSPEQYVPHVKLTDIGQLEVIQIWHEDNVEALREAAGWPSMDLTKPVRRLRAKVATLESFLKLDNGSAAAIKRLQEITAHLDAQIAHGDDLNEVIPIPAKEAEGLIYYRGMELEPSPEGDLRTALAAWELLIEEELRHLEAEIRQILLDHITQEK